MANLLEGYMLFRKMNAKHFRWFFIALAVGWWFCLNNSSQPTIGISQEIHNGEYRIAAGSAPWALWFAGLILALYACLMLARPAEFGQGVVSRWRRVAAFFVDFFLALAIIAPVAGLIPLVAEWHRTAIFAWDFERTTYAPGDALVSGLTFVLAIPVLLLYIALPLVRGRPTPGACALGYQIVSDGGARITPLVALKRTVCGVTFLGDRKSHVVKIDRWFHTHAVKLK